MNPVSTFLGPCGNPNSFSSVVAPAVEKRLLPQGSVAGIVRVHLRSVWPFFQTVSRELCDDALLSMESAHSATRFTRNLCRDYQHLGGIASYPLNARLSDRGAPSRRGRAYPPSTARGATRRERNKVRQGASGGCERSTFDHRWKRNHRRDSVFQQVTAVNI